MPAMTPPKTPLALGAGYLLYADFGTSLPTNTVTASAFSDSWPAGWNLLGVTKEGHEFSYEISVDQIDSAEYYDPLQYVTSGRVSGIKFEMQIITATNWKRALNGGSLTTSGSGTTLKSTYTPPNPGAEVRCMIGWESNDSTERLAMEQAFQVGSLTVSRNKGPANATLPLEFRGEVAGSGYPFQYWTAGTARG